MAPVSFKYLSIRGGLKETQAVSKPFAGQTHFDLFFKDGGSALEHHMVSLQRGKGVEEEAVDIENVHNKTGTGMKVGQTGGLSLQSKTPRNSKVLI